MSCRASCANVSGSGGVLTRASLAANLMSGHAAAPGPLAHASHFGRAFGGCRERVGAERPGVYFHGVPDVKRKIRDRFVLSPDLAVIERHHEFTAPAERNCSHDCSDLLDTGRLSFCSERPLADAKLGGA